MDFADFLLFVSEYGLTDPLFDLDGDGTVGFSDFLIFVSNYGKRSPQLAYNIDLVFGEGFTPQQKEVIRRAARHWEQIIVGDLPDVDASFVDMGIIDDMTIEVKTEFLSAAAIGWGGPITWTIGGKHPLCCYTPKRVKSKVTEKLSPILFAYQVLIAQTSQQAL